MTTPTPSAAESVAQLYAQVAEVRATINGRYRDQDKFNDTVTRDLERIRRELAAAMTRLLELAPDDGPEPYAEYGRALDAALELGGDGLEPAQRVRLQLTQAIIAHAGKWTLDALVAEVPKLAAMVMGDDAPAVDAG